MFLEALIKIVEFFGGAGMVILLLLLAVAFWCTVKIASAVEKTKSLDIVNKDIHEINKNISAIQGNVEHIIGRLSTLEGKTLFADKHSPMQLNEKGKKLVERTIGPIIDEKYEEIKKRYDFNTIENPFDIEQKCKDIALDIFDYFSSSDEKDKIKKELFFDGANLNDLYFITRIYLRDKILEEKGISLDRKDE